MLCYFTSVIIINNKSQIKGHNCYMGIQHCTKKVENEAIGSGISLSAIPNRKSRTIQKMTMTLT